MSEQMEVRPDESISQVSTFAVNENQEDEEDIYGEPSSVHPASSSEFRSRNCKAYPDVMDLTCCLPLLAAHFKMTPETRNEGKRFLKVFTIHDRVIQAKYQGTMARIYIQIRGYCPRE